MVPQKKWQMAIIETIGAITTAIEGGKAIGEVLGKAAEALKQLDEEKASMMHKEASGGMSSDAKAMERLLKKKELEQAEKDLYNVIASVAGFSTWQELQKMRSEQRAADKRATRELMAKRERKREMVFSIIIAVGGTAAIGSIIFLILVF